MSCDKIRTVVCFTVALCASSVSGLFTASASAADKQVSLPVAIIPEIPKGNMW